MHFIQLPGSVCIICPMIQLHNLKLLVIKQFCSTHALDTTFNPIGESPLCTIDNTFIRAEI